MPKKIFRSRKPKDIAKMKREINMRITEIDNSNQYRQMLKDSQQKVRAFIIYFLQNIDIIDKFYCAKFTELKNQFYSTRQKYIVKLGYAWEKEAE